MDIKQFDQEYIASTYSRLDLLLVKGQGSLCYDEKGKEYIDLGAGVAVNSFGFADSVWLAAVTRQLGRLQHACNYYYSEPQAILAEKLCTRTGFQKVFFSNSGAEANECAIKAARKYGQDHYGETRPNIVTLINSFHGRTIATLAATGQESMHRYFGPFPPGFLYAPANDIAAMETLLADGSVCAVMMELVQGEGGVNVLDTAYIQAVADLCAKNDVLLMVDEVQTGNGRTGALYAYMHYDIRPDIVTTAKGLGGGLPIGATMLGAKLENTLTTGTHGSTFGGNPVSAAGAVTILDRLTDKLMEEVREKSAYIKAGLSGAKGVKSVSGLGLMLGIETEKDAHALMEACMRQGVLVLVAKDRVRLVPALTIPFPQLTKAVDILKAEIER